MQQHEKTPPSDSTATQVSMSQASFSSGMQLNSTAEIVPGEAGGRRKGRERGEGGREGGRKEEREGGREERGNKCGE